MNLNLNRLLFFCFVALLSCYEEQEIPVVIDIDYSVTGGSYTVPVEVTLENKTAGANFYKWTFEGATPSTSDKKEPGVITYDKAGTYTIRLEAWNDTQRDVNEITVVLDSAVTIDFSAEILVNDIAPATVVITNLTKGASSFTWTFEGGDPGTSTEQHPDAVVFNTAGDHTISLTVSNGREEYTLSKVITLKDELAVDFEIEPLFEDEDYEAPLTASLVNKTVGGLRYSWSASGGNIADDDAENTSIFFSDAGDYTVTLEVDNDKEVKSVTRNIHVKPNTNLYTITDLKLGVSAAHPTIGAFLAPKLRDVLTKSEVTEANGSLVDVLFYGINSGFSYCRFISPDSATKFTFPEIPHASHTYFVNTLESTSISFSAAQFDDMTNDAPLAPLDIRNNDTGIAFFSNSVAPRIILFETKDGRKGAIKIREFVSAGTQSYILVDVKIQKLKP